MAFCEQCGSELKLGDRFCTECGAPVKGPQPTSANEETQEVPVNNGTVTVNQENTFSEVTINNGATYDYAPSGANDNGGTYVYTPNDANDNGGTYGYAPNGANDNGGTYGYAPNGTNGNGGTYGYAPNGTNAMAGAYNTANNMGTATPTKKKKKFPIVLVIILIIALVLAVVGICFGISRSKTMDINEYTTVEFSGYETVGKAEVCIDEARFYADFIKKSNIKNKPKNLDDIESLDALLDTGVSIADIDENIDYELDKEEALSNGDNVNLKWKINADYLKKNYGVKIKSEDAKFTAEGLKEVDIFNPFDDINVIFSGVNGKGTCEIEVTSKDDIYDGIYFTMDKSSKLSEGDTITVTFGEARGEELVEYCADHYGMLPKETTKEYKVEGLGEYISSTSQLSNEAIAEMTDKATELFRNDIENANLGELNAKVNGNECVGAVVIYNRDGSGNKIDIVCKLDVTITSQKQSGENILTYYRTASFYDVAVNKNNECSYDLEHCDVNDNSTFEYKTTFKFVGRVKWAAKVYGFESLDDITSFIADTYDVAYDVDSNLASSAEGADSEDENAEGEDTESQEESEE